MLDGSGDFAPPPPTDRPGGDLPQHGVPATGLPVKDLFCPVAVPDETVPLALLEAPDGIVPLLQQEEEILLGFFRIVGARHFAEPDRGGVFNRADGAGRHEAAAGRGAGG